MCRHSSWILPAWADCKPEPFCNAGSKWNHQSVYVVLVQLGSDAPLKHFVVSELQGTKCSCGVQCIAGAKHLWPRHGELRRGYDNPGVGWSLSFGAQRFIRCMDLPCQFIGDSHTPSTGNPKKNHTVILMIFEQVGKGFRKVWSPAVW